MKNNNVLKVRELHNRGIKSETKNFVFSKIYCPHPLVTNCKTTSIWDKVYEQLDFPFKHNYFVFVVFPNGCIKPIYRVFSNRSTAICFARTWAYPSLYCSLYDAHVEVLKFN